MKNIVLIQLVSEQTMQNVLPVLALRPSRLIHLTTPKVASRSQWIAEAARHAGIKVPLENIQLSPMPGIRETANALAQATTSVLKDGNCQPVVNFTGGTKLMSIGAYACAANEKIVSMYVDTEYHHFTDGQTGGSLADLLGGDLSFTPYQKQLTVNMIAVANGRQRVTAGRPFDNYLPLARHLLNNSADAQACWEAVDGEKGLCPRGHEPKNAAGWLELCKKPVHIPPNMVAMIMESGLFRQQEGAVFLEYPQRAQLEAFASKPPIHAFQRYLELVNPLQFARCFLAGGWWEIAVADAVRQSGRFRDVRWGADAGSRRLGDSMEEDILAVDGVQIAYFSCKRGGAGGKLSRQLEEMHASAQRLGGRFVSKHFCVCIPPGGMVRESLYRRAAELGVGILTRDDLLQPDCFKA
jgi:hypothetical protein